MDIAHLRFVVGLPGYLFRVLDTVRSPDIDVSPYFVWNACVFQEKTYFEAGLSIVDWIVLGLRLGGRQRVYLGHEVLDQMRLHLVCLAVNWHSSYRYFNENHL